MPEIQSPNVLLNQWSDAERAAFVADYNRQGPAGRPAPAASSRIKTLLAERFRISPRPAPRNPSARGRQGGA
jgi:hypothetical protein